MRCYQEIGCCLTCDDKDAVEAWNGEDQGCLCFSCLCSKCDELLHGRCQIAASALSWEDYVEMAEAEQKRIRKLYGSQQINFEAIFSNGTLVHHVFYCNPLDIPSQIQYFLKEGYPYRTRTLLLKRAFESNWMV